MLNGFQAYLEIQGFDIGARREGNNANDLRTAVTYVHNPLFPNPCNARILGRMGDTQLARKM